MTAEKTTYCMGFQFSELEVIAMRRVCRNAKNFMKKYGQGEQPGANIKPLNKRDYITGPLEEEAEDED